MDGKLHPLFQEWCESLYPGAYQDCILDEYLLVDKNSPRAIALAKLMLLDCGIVEFTEPYLHAAATRSVDTSYDYLMRFLFRVPAQEEAERPIVRPHPILGAVMTPDNPVPGFAASRFGVTGNGGDSFTI